MFNKIDFLDLKKQYQHLQSPINRAITRVLSSGQFILGQEVDRFEKAIAKYLGIKYAIGVASGTDALILSLMTLNIGSGDEVITTAFSFIASANTISRVGAKPVFVDIDPKTFNIDANQIEQKITKNTKVIIPVHLYGQMSDMNKVMNLARQYKLFVIEDACQAIGATYKNKKAGSIGHLGCFSFFPTKNLGAYGDGGLITTNNKNWAEMIKILRTHGAKEKYCHRLIGLNSRLDELQTGILNVKLKYLNQWNQQRIKKAATYNQELHQYKIVPQVNPCTSWEEITDNGWIKKSHDPNGNTLYVVSIGVSPLVSRRGLGTTLLEAQKKLTCELSLKYLVLGSRVPEFAAWHRQNPHSATAIQQFLETKNQKKESLDSLIRFYERAGLKIIKIVSNYMGDDPESENYGVIMSWLNQGRAR